MSGFVDTGPVTGAVSVTPDDTDLLANISRALWVGEAGNMAVVMADDTEVTFAGIAAGTLLPIRVKRVNDTDTTAASILALY